MSTTCLIRSFSDAILGVSLFADVAPDQFGRFNRAFISMFRVAAGDTWVDPLPILDRDGDIAWKPALFICSFMVLTVWVVLQVSVAVLLDNFVTVTSKLENEDKMNLISEKKSLSHFKNPLEPLIAKLAQEYTDSTDLTSKLNVLFQVMFYRTFFYCSVDFGF